MKKCLNCGKQLDEKDTFCPNCGQSAKDRRVSFKTLLFDFFGDLFAFDSKFFRSIIPLLFRPGYLSRKYFEGKRIAYIPPWRMYIFISFIYFLLLSYKTSSIRINKIKMDETDTEVVDSLLQEIVDERVGQEADTSLFDLNFSLNEGGGDRVSFSEILRMEREGMDEEEIADSIGFKTKLARKAVANVIRLYRTEGQAFFPVLFNNISWMMFALIPVFALILKLLYIRKDYYYLEHLVFGFHFHAFLFIVLLIILFTTRIDLLTPLLIAIIFIYLFVAMWKTYKQSIGMILLKYFSLIGIYGIVFILGSLATLLLSFLFM